MKRYCLTLDLKSDAVLIGRYEAYHQHVWPEIKQSIRESGIIDMEIYRYETRLFMIIEADDDFDFKKKKKLDDNNPIVKQWEDLMSQFQNSLPNAAPGEKWQLMTKIFNLDK